jgi:hypothetical protein
MRNPMTSIDTISRREALRRTALLLGGTLAASTITAAERAVWAATPGWAPRTLSAQQSEMVATIAEHIIPATDTPGARAAGVHRLVDVLLSDYYGPAERGRFLAGLNALNDRALGSCGAPFLRCSAANQVALLTAVDAEAYPPQSMVTKPELPMSTSANLESNGLRPDPRTGWFFRRMKELTVLGYYTSEPGATKELRVTPMGAYRGDVPYNELGRAWS